MSLGQTLRCGASLLVFAGASSAAAAQTAAPVEQAVPASADTPVQDDAAAPAAEAAADDTIVVTGTRLRTGTFNSPTPVTAVTQQELFAAAPSNLSDGLKQLPAITPGGGQTQGGGTRAGGQNFLNLRGLGNARTLVLLDGRRFVPSGPDLLIDVNLFPQGLVQRVDVVTGGASATYGSDAVAGVVNFILDKRFTGLKFDTSYGISERGDNREFKATVSAGVSLFDNRLHIVAGGEYYDGDGVDGSKRDFRQMAGNQITNPTGTPRLVRANDIRTPFTTGGLVVVGTGGAAAANNQIFGIQFAPGGTPTAYDYGTLSTTLRNAGGTQNGGDGFRVSTGQEIVRPLTRKSAFAHVDLELSDTISLFGEGLYGKTNALFQNSPTTRTLAIARANPFLATAAPALVAQMTTLGVTGLSLNRLTFERGPTVTENDNETIRLMGGVEGKLGGWRWDLSYQYGRNKTYSPTYNNLIIPNFTRAVNAVRAVAGNPGGFAVGTIVCADQVSATQATRDAATGCTPFNPFGAGSPSDASLNYVFGTSVFDTTTKQQVFDANVSGTLFDLPAGPVALAAGAEWRRVSANTVADPLSIAGSYRLINQQNFFGRYTIKEVFGEIQLPILKDSAIARSLDVNLAGRHTDYSTSGGVNTWKVGLVWQVVNDLRLRGTYSRDIRAPQLEELFATGRQNNITIVDTGLTNQTYLSVPNLTFGNAALTPEKAKTKVVGFVYQPSWLPSFSLAVDYYNIRINDAILNVGGQNAVTQCNLSGQTSPICAFVTRAAGTNAVTGTRTSPLNLTAQETAGVDVEALYRVPLDAWFGGDPGKLSLRGVLSYVDNNRVLNPLIANPVDDAGNLRPQSIQSAQPHWRGTLSTNYESEHLGIFLQGRYIGALTWDKTLVLGTDTDFNHISPQFYLDGQISFKAPFLGNKQELFINVQNLLDHQPPYAPNPTGATPLPTNPDLYDQVGRMFRFGLRARF